MAFLLLRKNDGAVLLYLVMHFFRRSKYTAGTKVKAIDQSGLGEVLPDSTFSYKD